MEMVLARIEALVPVLVLVLVLVAAAVVLMVVVVVVVLYSQMWIDWTRNYCHDGDSSNVGLTSLCLRCAVHCCLQDGSIGDLGSAGGSIVDEFRRLVRRAEIR